MTIGQTCELLHADASSSTILLTSPGNATHRGPRPPLTALRAPEHAPQQRLPTLQCEACAGVASSRTCSIPTPRDAILDPPTLHPRLTWCAFTAWGTCLPPPGAHPRSSNAAWLLTANGRKPSPMQDTSHEARTPSPLRYLQTAESHLPCKATSPQARIPSPPKLCTNR